MATKVLVTPRSFGQVSPEPLELLRAQGCEVVLNPYGRILTKSEMMQHIGDADAVIVGVDPIDKEVIERAHRLKVISKYGVGTDNIDLRAAKERGIQVTVTAGANTEAVADYTFTLMLAAARKLLQIDKECRKRNWSKITTVDMYKRTLGLIGLGNIGKAVARRASGFNMNLVAYDLTADKEFSEKYGVRYASSIDDILKEADFISLHLPLTPRTHKIIGEREFALMKPTAVIVNTARGGLIDEEALYRALRDHTIWGAGLDVFEQEPPENIALLELDNIIIGSHCAASTLCAIDNMGVMASQNIIKFIGED